MIALHSARLSAQILPLGATLAGLWYDGHPDSLVIGATDANAYRDELRYSGAIIGPIANRISNAALDIGGTVWRMDANEGSTSLHSGAHGLHAQVWQVVEHASCEVSLRCCLPHGTNGLPGNRTIDVRYRLTDDARLSLELKAQTDRTTAINLAHHPYWTLVRSQTIAHHRLQVFADQYLPVDDTTLPTGDIASVAGTPYDFRAPRNVPTNETLDANLCLSTQRWDAPRPAARLMAPSGLTLEVDTTEPGLQVYNGSGLRDVGIPLHDGRVLQPFAGIALEPQLWPNAPHHSAFPSILVHADAPYTQTTTYRILDEFNQFATV